MTASDPFLLPSVSAARQSAARMGRMLIVDKCVRLTMIDQSGQPVRSKSNGAESGARVASGFLRRQADGLYLYTCWHVVTGISYLQPTLPVAGSQRAMALDVTLMDALPEGELMEGIGGKRTFRLPLYDETVSPPRPLWEQYLYSEPCSELEAVGLRLPQFHDVARMKLDETSTFISSLEAIASEDTWRDLVAPGDPLYIAGFPYGFSASEKDITAVLLARHSAQMSIWNEAGGPFLDVASRTIIRSSMEQFWV